MAPPIDTLLLLALPASGKSELRRYIGSVNPEVARRDFHLGPVVQLDDYPYVHMMRRISEEMLSMGIPGSFFPSTVEPFAEPLDWGTLIHLLNEDYAALGPSLHRPSSAANWLFDRLDRGRRTVGATPVLGSLDAETRGRLRDALEEEAVVLWTDLDAAVSAWEPGSTVIIEFARGGPDGSHMPLPEPYGYQYSLGQLSQEIKQRASVLYIWVTPEESRRRNLERARPGRDGDSSILFHGVPDAVMYGDYGVDDLVWLAGQSGGHSITLDHHRIPLAVFDNRNDRTSFLRSDQSEWPEERTSRLHADLSAALESLG